MKTSLTNKSEKIFKSFSVLIFFLEIYKKIFTHFLFFIKEYSFKKKKLRRLYTETFSFRKKHIRILENFGFELEGRMKKHVIKNKKTYDSLIHGILNKWIKN